VVEGAARAMRDMYVSCLNFSYVSPQIYEEIVLILGLQGEFRGQCLPPGDVSVFAAIDIAWLAFFAKLSLTQEIIFESFTAILYDVILFSTITERFGEIQLFEEVRTL
jgi:hypothetical protein